MLGRLGRATRNRTPARWFGATSPTTKRLLYWWTHRESNPDLHVASVKCFHYHHKPTVERRFTARRNPRTPRLRILSARHYEDIRGSENPAYPCRYLVATRGIEPRNSCMSSKRVNRYTKQLCMVSVRRSEHRHGRSGYRPVVKVEGFEPPLHGPKPRALPSYAIP